MDRYAHQGLTFDVTDAGPAGGRTVVLLHGFPADRHAWSGVTARLAAAGYRTLAPDQRGYSPGACPARRRDYVMDRLVGDVLALADAAGADRFDVVGHDWGAAVAWSVAARHPGRVRTLTAISVPHPRAMQRSMLSSRQFLASWYLGLFQLPWLPERILGSVLQSGLVKDGLDPASAARYRDHATTPALNWYRALPFYGRRPEPAVTVPTLFVWSDRDRYVTRAAARQCGRFVTGPYRFVALPGVSHWIPEREPDTVADLVLDQLGTIAGESV